MNETKPKNNLLFKILKVVFKHDWTCCYPENRMVVSLKLFNLVMWLTLCIKCKTKKKSFIIAGKDPTGTTGKLFASLYVCFILLFL